MRVERWLSSIRIGVILPGIFLVILGIVMLSNLAPSLLWVQLTALAIATIVFILIANIDYHLWKDLGWTWYVVCIVFLLLTLIIGAFTRGTNRWLLLGPVSIQPSEIVRPFIIVFLASMASQESLNWTWRLIKQAVVFALPAVILFLQPDLGSVILLGMGWMGILVAQRMPVRYWILGLMLVLVLLPVGWSVMHDYQRSRILTFVSPGSDPLGSGYNVLQAKVAVGSGQLMGRGLGRGTQSHLRFLPEFHTDFMFASIAEELGLVGSLLVIVLYLGLFSEFVRSITNSRDSFGMLAAAGLFTSLFGQVVVNIGMNLGVMPVTGLTLPLLSYGGSSLLATAIFLGLVNSIANGRKQSTQYLHIH